MRVFQIAIVLDIYKEWEYMSKYDNINLEKELIYTQLFGKSMLSELLCEKCNIYRYIP